MKPGERKELDESVWSRTRAFGDAIQGCLDQNSLNLLERAILLGAAKELLTDIRALIDDDEAKAVTRYVIHREDCPALCQYTLHPNAYYGNEVSVICVVGHDSHGCRCLAPSPEELAELVEAAGWALVSLRGYDQDNAPNLPQADEVTRLDAALKPFTEEK